MNRYLIFAIISMNFFSQSVCSEYKNPISHQNRMLCQDRSLLIARGKTPPVESYEKSLDLYKSKWNNIFFEEEAAR